MSDQWFYQAFGEEHGPVSFEQLREMASKHQLTPQHRVRSVENSDWEEARCLPGLFPHLLNSEDELTAEDMQELDFESLQVVSQEKQSEWSSLEELDIQVSDAPTQTKTTSGPTDAYGSRWDDQGGAGEEDASAAVDEHQWICDVLGVQLGPMPLEDLRILARKGEIGLDDPVRRADLTEWQPAKSVEGLFPGFEFHSDVGLPEVESSPPPTKTKPPAPANSDDDFELAKGHLANPQSPQSPPRPRAARPAAKRPPQPPANDPPPQPAPAAKAVPPEEQKKADLDKWLSDAVPSPPPPSETAPPAQPAAPSPPAEPSQPVLSSEERAAQLRAEYEARTATTRTFTPPTPPKKVKSSGPGMGEQFSGLMGKLKENPKVLGVLVVLGLVFLIKYVPWPFGPSDQGTYDTVKAIGNTYKEMRSRKAPPAEFDSFKKQSLETIKPLKSELLDAGAGIHDRPKQELYWACGKLEKMLQAGLDGEPGQDETDYDRHMATAQALINGEPPPAPPNEEGEGDGESAE